MPALPGPWNSSSPGSTPTSTRAVTSSAVTSPKSAQSCGLRVTIASRSIGAQANRPHVMKARTTNTTRSVT